MKTFDKIKALNSEEKRALDLIYNEKAKEVLKDKGFFIVRDSDYLNSGFCFDIYKSSKKIMRLELLYDASVDIIDIDPHELPPRDNCKRVWLNNERIDMRMKRNIADKALFDEIHNIAFPLQKKIEKETLNREIKCAEVLK